MSKTIRENIQYFDGDRIISKESIKKKSDWLKVWKTRKIVLFQNRVCFFRCEKLGEEPSIQIPLSAISKLEGSDNNQAQMKIFSVQGNYQIEFADQEMKQVWKQIMTKAIRDFKIKKSQLLTINRLDSKKPSMDVSCQWLKML